LMLAEVELKERSCSSKEVQGEIAVRWRRSDCGGPGFRK
jgi:hypothetical protein